jgi:hypothetical protein
MEFRFEEIHCRLSAIHFRKPEIHFRFRPLFFAGFCVAAQNRPVPKSAVFGRQGLVVRWRVEIGKPAIASLQAAALEQGIQLFLRCHGRLCGLVGDFLPYGSTLFVAASLLRLCPAQDLAGELLAPDIKGYGAPRALCRNIADPVRRGPGDRVAR